MRWPLWILALLGRTAASPKRIVFIKLHRVGGTTFQNLLVRHALRRGQTLLCTTKVASFNSKSLEELAAVAASGAPPTNTGKWPIDVWVHHVALIRGLDLVTGPSPKIAAVVRAPERRFESAWAVFTARGVAEGREKGWGMGVYGLTPGEYCGNVTADPKLLALERVRRSTHVGLDGMTRALLGMNQQNREEPRPSKLAKLHALFRVLWQPWLGCTKT